MTRWRREGGNVVGLGEDGREAVRVPIREPLRVIQGWDPRLQAARTNCP
jgi:hypothetical protein